MNSEKKIIEKIRADYEPKAKSEVDELKELDKKVKRPVAVFGYVFGAISSLVLGLGMCLAMKIIGDMMILGIIIGLVGIGLMSLTYPLYKKILASRKKKYSKKIFELSDRILNK